VRNEQSPAAGGALRGVMAGAGFFAQFQAEAWRRVEGAEIAAVADLDRARAEEFAARWSIPRVYTDAAQMVAAEEPDFLDIVTGPETHRGLVELAAESGVNAICQKPMAVKPEDARAMVEIARQVGIRLLIHENWRWQAWYREARRLLDRDVLGAPYYLGFLMRTGDGRGEAPYAAQPYFKQMKRFLIFETLVHFLDTFRYLGGEVESVYCETRRLNAVMAGEDAAVIQMKFASGAQGVIDANRISGPFPSEPAFGRFRLEGGKGMLLIDGFGRMEVKEHGGEARAHECEMPQAGYKGDSVYAFQKHAVECLRGGGRCESEAEEYLKTVLLVEACYESAASGQPVKLADYGR
jgi:predicted dehydrogenase